jgi:hypothetical protein
MRGPIAKPPPGGQRDQVPSKYLHVDLPGNSQTLVSPSPPSSPEVSMNGRFNHQAKFGSTGAALVAKY